MNRASRALRTSRASRALEDEPGVSGSEDEPGVSGLDEEPGGVVGCDTVPGGVTVVPPSSLGLICELPGTFTRTGVGWYVVVPIVVCRPVTR